MGRKKLRDTVYVTLFWIISRGYVGKARPELELTLGSKSASRFRGAFTAKQNEGQRPTFESSDVTMRC